MLVDDADVSVLAFVALGAVITSIASWIFAITTAFRKAVEVEEYIASPGKQLDLLRSAYGNDLMGRWVRVVFIFNFFLFKKLPKYGAKIADRMGDEVTPVPWRLKRWIIVPVGTALGFALVFFVAAGTGMALDS